jgi:hypothetical protein
MINPDDKLPVDDFDNSETEDQLSQQDVHSNGLNEEFDSANEDSAPPIDLLQRHHLLWMLTEGMLLRQKKKKIESGFSFKAFYQLP